LTVLDAIIKQAGTIISKLVSHEKFSKDFFDLLENLIQISTIEFEFFQSQKLIQDQMDRALKHIIEVFDLENW